MISRINDEAKKPFGKLLSEQGVILEWVARSRIEIDAARLAPVPSAEILVNQNKIIWLTKIPDIHNHTRQRRHP